MDVNRRLWAEGVLLNVIPHTRGVERGRNHILRDYRLRCFRAVLFGPNWDAVLRGRVGESGISRREDGECLRSYESSLRSDAEDGSNRGRFNVISQIRQQ